MQVYAERLFALAQEAFAGQQGGLGAVESQIIGFFVDGLYHDFLKMKVIYNNPNTFQGAVTTVMNEQNLCRMFNLCCTSSPTIREEEPLEIGHVRPRKCYKCHKLGHIAKHCRSSHQSKSHVNIVSEQQHRGDYRPRAKNHKEPRLCFKCNNPNHLKRDCPQIKAKGPNSEN